MISINQQSLSNLSAETWEALRAAGHTDDLPEPGSEVWEELVETLAARDPRHSAALSGVLYDPDDALATEVGQETYAKAKRRYGPMDFVRTRLMTRTTNGDMVLAGGAVMLGGVLSLGSPKELSPSAPLAGTALQIVLTEQGGG